MHYNVSDKAGNKAVEVTRTVIVSEALDTEPPIIALNGEATIYINGEVPYIDAGVTITDNKDTDLVPITTYTKDGTEVEGIDTSEEGTYVIHYNVSDTEGNKAVEVTRTVIVDKTPPVVTLKGDSEISILLGSKYDDPGVTATDNTDAEIAITDDSATMVDTTKAGTYIVTYTATDVAGNTSTAERTVIVNDKMSNQWKIVSTTKNNVTGGATEYTVVTSNQYNWTSTSYLCEADISDESSLKILSGYNNYDASKWKMSTLSQQAKAAQDYFNRTPELENYKVTGILIGDTFNMSTGEPTGALVMQGEKYHNAGSRPYFAVLKDGTPVIRQGNVSLEDCESAVGGIDIILKDGEVISKPGDDYREIMYSRAAIGIKADGTVVTMCTKGFKIPDNYGLNFDEVASHLKVMGCVDGLMLDGGGSAQWSSMYEGSDELAVRTKPSDGHERSVSSSIMLVSVAGADGQFDHANITPKDEVYTPDSTVFFSATGADSTGNPADIPEDALWAVADESYGTIDENGIFTSTGKTGDVTIQVLYNGKTAGETTITIVGPNTITFNNPEINIGRGDESDLGLKVLYNGKSVNYKANDLIWTLSDPNMGTVNNETNTFTASSDLTISGTVTVTSVYDESVSGTVKVNVGQEPTLVFDFEDYKNEDGTVTPSYTYWGADEKGRITGRLTGSDYLEQPTGKLTTLFYNRGGNESADIVSREDGYPVHSGTYSLKINYDMSKATGTEGANIGLTENLYIPGYPTGLGLWVYVPEDVPNLWLRTRMSIVGEDGKVESTTQYDYTEEIKNAFPARGSYGGLADVERGSWKLLVMDLSQYAGSKFMIPSGENIRLMWTSSNATLTSDHNPRTDVTASHGIYLPDGTTIAQKDCVGSIYIDDFMFIYGSINEDTKAPTVTSLTANETEISKDMAFDTDSINFSAIFKDEYDDENSVEASGIDVDNVYMYIDGISMEKTVKDTVTITLDGVKLANGEHSIKLLVTDNAGNEKIANYEFIVDAVDNKATKVQLTARQNVAPLGGKLDLDVISDEVSDIDSVTTTLKINSKYKDSYEVVAGEGYTVDKDSISYNNIHNTVTFTVNRNADAVSSGEGKLATVTFEIPKNIVDGSYFTYSVDAGSIIYVNSYEGDNEPSFSSLKHKIPVGSTYVISSDIIVAGMDSGYFYVKDTDGSAVTDATLYFSDGTEIGKVDSEGKVEIPSSILNGVTGFEVYAKDSNENISFSYTGQSYNAGGEADNGNPIYILNNPTSNGFTARNISWISNPLYSEDAAQIRISESKDNIENGSLHIGASELYAFNGSSDVNENYVARINGVIVEGLTSGKTYYYQVGDGNTWSDTKILTMSEDDGDINMFVLGDIQADDLTNIQTILKSLKEDDVDYDLGIQTGDAVDFASSYSHWDEALGLLDTFENSQVLLHVVGNHELTGESGGEITAAMYNMENPSYYSTDYGSVYVATISFTDSMKSYEEALKWLVEDANKSNAKYKILAMHQPAYYTNASDPSNARLNELLPRYVEDAGIDIVFAGHDHSYARTKEINDVTYYICGTSGEKAYPVTDNKDWFNIATDKFNAIYLTLNATDEALTVTTYDIVDGKPKEFDKYTKSK